MRGQEGYNSEIPLNGVKLQTTFKIASWPQAAREYRHPLEGRRWDNRIYLLMVLDAFFLSLKAGVRESRYEDN